MVHQARETRTQTTCELLVEELAQAFRRVNDQQEFPGICERILSEWVGLFKAESAALWLVNRQTRCLECSAVYEMPQTVFVSYQAEPLALERLTERAQGDEPIAVPELPAGVFAAAVASDRPHGIFFPVRLQGKLVGALSWSGQIPFPEALRPQADLFREFSGQALANAYLIHHLRLQNGQLELMMVKLQNAQNQARRVEQQAWLGKIAESVAHEIRNPLSILGSSLHLLADKVFAGQAALVETMKQKIRAMDAIVRDLLLLARPMPVQLAPASFKKVMENIHPLLAPKFQAQAAEWAQEISESLPAIQTDPKQLEKIFLHLTLHALQHSGQGGRVELTASAAAEPGRLVVFLGDNGPSRTAEETAKIFEPFSNAHPELGGLGLFPDKLALENLGARIEAQNRSGQGACFRISLPLAGQTS
jgi:signal transduction histidine kinase